MTVFLLCPHMGRSRKMSRLSCSVDWSVLPCNRRLWFWLPVGVHTRGNQLRFLSHVNVSLFPFFSLKSINISLVRIFFKCRKKSKLFCVSHYKGTNPIMRSPPSRPNLLPPPPSPLPPPKSITLETRVSTCRFEVGYKHSVPNHHSC